MYSSEKFERDCEKMTPQIDKAATQNPVAENPARRPWIKPALERLSLNAALADTVDGLGDGSFGYS
jgi:hypothetical protein